MENIFTKEPEWSLRGDPFLWEEMKSEFKNFSTPVSLTELETLIKTLFKRLTKEEMECGKNIFIKRYDNGGMSTGVVSASHWCNTIFPTLKKRFQEQNNVIVKIAHKFLNHNIDPNTETLVIGTFNPDAKNNEADFFYGRSRNYLWKILSTTYKEENLKGVPKTEKLTFIKKNNIDFVDLIEEVGVKEGEEENYFDGYIDDKVTKWKDVKLIINNLNNLKRVCFTRKTFSEIPNMKPHIEAIEQHCHHKRIPFKLLTTPSRYYNEDKQIEWSKFLLDDSK